MLSDSPKELDEHLARHALDSQLVERRCEGLVDEGELGPVLFACWEVRGDELEDVLADFPLFELVDHLQSDSVSVEEHGGFKGDVLLEVLEVVELSVDFGVLQRELVQLVELEELDS